MTNNILGSRISALLRKSGLTQRRLAEQVGVTEVSISRYVNGKRIPKGPIVVSIANALHTTVEDLMEKEAKESDPDFEYYRCKRAIACSAKHWSQKQKADLVDILFGKDS